MTCCGSPPFSPLHNPVTPVTEDSAWWQVFKAATDAAGLQISTGIFPAATDSRHIRALGYPAFGFSPMARTPILLHDHDEYLGRDVFVHGVCVCVCVCACVCLCVFVCAQLCFGWCGYSHRTPSRPGISVYEAILPHLFNSKV